MVMVVIVVHDGLQFDGTGQYRSGAVMVRVETVVVAVMLGIQLPISVVVVGGGTRGG